jgi:hypothetical protein
VPERLKKPVKKFEGTTVMRESLIKRLKKNSYVPGKEKTWISSLPDERIYQLFIMLRNGDDCMLIGRYIQKKWGILPNSSPHSIAQGIAKFKSRISSFLIHPSNLCVPTNSPNNNIPDELESISHLTKLQLQRIHRMIAEEQEIGVKHHALSREIHALTALIKATTKAKEWAMDHEGRDPLTRRKWEAKKLKIEAQFSSLLKGSDDHSNLLKAADRFLDLCEKNAVTLDIGPNGENVLLKQTDKA